MTITQNTQRRGKSARVFTISIIWNETAYIASVQHCRVWMDWALSDDIKQYQHFIFIAFCSSVQKVPEIFIVLFIITFAHDDDDFVCSLSIYYSYSSFSFHVCFFPSRFFIHSFHFHHLLFLLRHFVGLLRSRFLKRFMRIPFGHFHILFVFRVAIFIIWRDFCAEIPPNDSLLAECIFIPFSTMSFISSHFSHFTFYTSHWIKHAEMFIVLYIALYCSNMCCETAASSAGRISDNCGVQIADRCFIVL